MLLLAAGAAQAQLRSIPEDAKRGEMRHLQETVVELNGNAVRLAPSAQIRDPSNRIVLPSTLAQTVLVKYLADPQGLPVRVWIHSSLVSIIAERSLFVRTFSGKAVPQPLIRLPVISSYASMRRVHAARGVRPNER